MKKQTLVTFLLLFTFSFALVAAASVETLSLSDIKSGAAKFDGHVISGEDAPKEALLKQYGTYAFETFKKHPELVGSLKKLKPKFDPHTMATSSPSGIVKSEGRTLLILNGCFPHNCGGTEQIVAFEPATKRTYLLEPTNVGPDTEPSGKFNLYGNPDPFVRAAMCSAYPIPQDSAN
jgi:hypothetical protein